MDTAAAVAVVTAATPTGTKTAILDTAAAPTIITTTHPANMHRMGRTIHPQHGKGISVVVFLGSPYSFAISHSRLCAQTESGDCACFTCHRRSSGRVTYSLHQRRVPPLLSHSQIKFITNTSLVAATVAAPTDTLAAVAAVATVVVVVVVAATVEVATAVVVVVVVTGWVSLALVSRLNNGVWYHVQIT